jgi:hypothetical protein
MSGIVAARSTQPILTTGRLPNLRVSRPLSCMENSAPMAGQSSAKPSCPSLIRRSPFSCGICVNQADSSSPTVKYTVVMAQRARIAPGSGPGSGSGARRDGCPVTAEKKRQGRTGSGRHIRPRRSRRPR